MSEQRGRWKAPYNLDRLVEVAVRVFTERGYDGTSLQHLTQASGLSRSSIYHHIESKEQLLRLGLERALEPLMASTTEDSATTGRALDRLTYLIRRNVEILAAELPYVRLLLSVHGNTETERWALEQRRTFDKFVAGVVQEAPGGSPAKGSTRRRSPTWASCRRTTRTSSSPTSPRGWASLAA